MSPGFAAFGSFQVDGAAALVPVDREEIGALAGDEGRTESTAVVAVDRLLDLDDVRAQIGQLHRCERSGDHPGEIEYPDAGQWLGAHVVSL
jgi:hypothetical protein